MSKIMTIPLIVGVSDRYVPVIPPGTQIETIYVTPGTFAAANGQLFLFGYKRETNILGREPADETNGNIVASAVGHFTNTISSAGGYAFHQQDSGGWNKVEGVRYVISGNIYPLAANGKLIVKFR